MTRRRAQQVDLAALPTVDEVSQRRSVVQAQTAAALSTTTDHQIAVLLLEAQDAFNRAKAEWASGEHVESPSRLRLNLDQVTEWLRVCLTEVDRVEGGAQ